MPVGPVRAAVVPGSRRSVRTVGWTGAEPLQSPLPLQVATRDISINKQLYFSVDGTPVEPRRVVVDTSKCNACHANLALHGGSRNRTQECVICHNPTKLAGGTPGPSIDFAVMVHKIHRGSALANGHKIGTADFSEVGYPGDLRNCATCHVNNSQLLPLAPGLAQVVNPQSYISPAGLATAACLACHDTKAAAAHAAVNTDANLGESCDTCHGTDGQFSVIRVHAR
jgi:OmcA/MtrC family decaheme c-type cytochrome